jgi:hypothetical protein
MSPFASALWGMAGALAVDAVAVIGEIHRKKGRWPWTRRQAGPRLLATALRVGIAALAAGAMSGELVGAWPAVCAGVTAPLIFAQAAARTPLLSRSAVEDGVGS